MAKVEDHKGRGTLTVAPPMGGYRKKPTASSGGNFKPDAKLDASQITDRRLQAPRTGQSSVTKAQADQYMKDQTRMPKDIRSALQKPKPTPGPAPKMSTKQGRRRVGGV